MSLRDKVDAAKNAEGTATATAPKPKVSGGKADKNKKADAFKATGAAARAKLSEEEKAIEGSKSDTLIFKAVLGDPSQKSSRKKDGQYHNSIKVCGYQFVSTEDIMRPKAPLMETAKSGMDGQTPATEVPAKAGEVMNLNVLEAAMLLSKMEYGGTASGEGMTVYLYPVTTGDSEKVRPGIKSTQGSIKDNMIPIAEMVDGSAVLKDGFEDFAPLLKKRKATRPGRKGEGIKDTAAAFRNMFAGM